MEKQYLEVANKFSLRSFVNSLIRDFNTDNRVIVDDKLKLLLSEGEVSIPFEKKSSLGAHSYESKIQLNSDDISFQEFVRIVARNFSASPNVDVFCKRVIDSRNNIANILKFNIDDSVSSYLESEKKLFFGHPFHPYPKCKEGMKENDLTCFSPEFKGEFRLTWIRVKAKDLISSLDSYNLKKEIAFLIEKDLPGVAISEDEVLLPYHPWQLERLLEKDILPPQFEILGKGKLLYSSLSSMRSVFNSVSPFQMKYSMDIRLTNSIRHLKSNETLRGRHLYLLLKNEEIIKSDSRLQLLNEPFSVALKNSDGDIYDESVIQFRENFSETKRKTNKYLLSTLCEQRVDTGKTHLSEIIERDSENHRLSQKVWFNNFLQNVICPYLDLAHGYGILLGAHMQNIIVELDEGRPVGSIFRDCQGTGYTKKSFEQYLKKYPFLEGQRGNILSEEDVNKVFGYYLIVNTVFGTISAIANRDSEVEEQLLYDLRTFLASQKYKSSSFVKYLLNSETLFQKANMKCSLKNYNENTISNPWELYNEIENPLKKLREIESLKNTVYLATLTDGRDVKLRLLTESDIDIFHKWHNQDFVSEFWEMDKTKEELLQYIQKVQNSPFQTPLVVELDDRPVGYFELYWANEDRIAPYCNPDTYDRGLHLLFGEKDVLRTRFVYDAILVVCKYIFESDRRTKRIWGEPKATNKKMLKVSEKIPGWRHIRDFDFPHKRASLLECERGRFYWEYDRGI